MSNLVIHRHIGNYQPMFDTENPVGIMYIVTSMREINGIKEYDLISSRFEVKSVNEDMLKSLFIMGAVCGGAKMDGDKVIMASEKKKEQAKDKGTSDKSEEVKTKKTTTEKTANIDVKGNARKPSTKAGDKKTSKK